MWTFFKDSLMTVINKHIPSGTGNKCSDLPWINRKAKNRQPLWGNQIKHTQWPVFVSMVDPNCSKPQIQGSRCARYWRFEHLHQGRPQAPVKPETIQSNWPGRPTSIHTQRVSLWISSSLHTSVWGLPFAGHSTIWLDFSLRCPNLQKRRSSPGQQLPTCLIDVGPQQSYGTYCLLSHNETSRKT